MSENKKCLLVIDDEQDLCETIKGKFEPLGYEVLTANDGAEGLQRVEEGKPDCVLLDVRIKRGEDGLTFLRKLRTYQHEDLQVQMRFRKTPVIILTGSGATLQPLFEFEGISGYIEKPFDLNNLQAKVEHVLRMR